MKRSWIMLLVGVSGCIFSAKGEAGWPDKISVYGRGPDKADRIQGRAVAEAAGRSSLIREIRALSLSEGRTVGDLAEERTLLAQHLAELVRDVSPVRAGVDTLHDTAWVEFEIDTYKIRNLVAESRK